MHIHTYHTYTAHSIHYKSYTHTYTPHTFITHTHHIHTYMHNTINHTHTMYIYQIYTLLHTHIHIDHLYYIYYIHVNAHITHIHHTYHTYAYIPPNTTHSHTTLHCTCAVISIKPKLEQRVITFCHRPWHHWNNQFHLCRITAFMDTRFPLHHWYLMINVHGVLQRVLHIACAFSSCGGLA